MTRTTGYHTVRINRKKLPFDVLDVKPDYEVQDMNELAELLKAAGKSKQ
jgi:hypothetical protein